MRTVCQTATRRPRSLLTISSMIVASRLSGFMHPLGCANGAESGMQRRSVVSIRSMLRRRWPYAALAGGSASTE